MNHRIQARIQRLDARNITRHRGGHAGAGKRAPQVHAQITAQRGKAGVARGVLLHQGMQPGIGIDRHG